jgi:N-acetylmuramoyl-L-alanine amidase
VLEGVKLRKDTSDGDRDWEQNFTVIYKTGCPAILTENMFMDSKSDLEFLQSEEGIEKLLQIHYNGVRRWFEDRKGTHDSWVKSQSEN